MSKAQTFSGIDSIKGVIFDMDGTLVDSKLDFNGIRQELGFPEDQPILEHIATLDSAAQIAEAHATIQRHEMEAAATAQWMTGAREFLDSLIEQQLPVALLTRNMRAATRLTCESLAIPINTVLTREDCAPKPDPEGLHQIARQWQIPNQQLVYIGDYIFDVEAANRAGMVSCWYRNFGQLRPMPDRDIAAEADWIIDHFNELRDALQVL